jgi:hypothetical protein
MERVELGWWRLFCSPFIGSETVSHGEFRYANALAQFALPDVLREELLYRACMSSFFQVVEMISWPILSRLPFAAYLNQKLIFRVMSNATSSILFALAHCRNHADPLEDIVEGQSITAEHCNDVVVPAFLQVGRSCISSAIRYFPLYESYGLLASVASHQLWNICSEDRYFGWALLVYTMRFWVSEEHKELLWEEYSELKSIFRKTLSSLILYPLRETED